MRGKLRAALVAIPFSLLGASGCRPDGVEIIRDAGTTGGGGNTGGAGGGQTGQMDGAAGTGGTAGSGGNGGNGGMGGTGMGGAGGAGGARADAGTGGAMAGGNLCTASGKQFDCNNVLKGMDGYLNRDDAEGPSQGSDAIQVNCTPSDAPDQQVVYKQQHWQLGGTGITKGKMYKVGLHFYGVVECKTYNGGTGPAKTDKDETPNVSRTHNLWLNGARDNGDHWNTYAFTITPMSLGTVVGIGPQDGTLPNVADTHFINQCPGNRGEGHFTWNIDFEASITVPGGSFINYVEYDSNCRMIANCGAAEASQTCPAPYNIVSTVTNAVPKTSAAFTQPIANTANPPSRGQWWLVDVTGITEM